MPQKMLQIIKYKEKGLKIVKAIELLRKKMK